MLTRRTLITAATSLPLLAHASGSFDGFLEGLREEAARDGIRSTTLDAALTGLAPNAHVLELDHNQPEFTLTWAQYRAKVLPASRIEAGRAAYARQARLLAEVTQRYGADPRVVVGIWGLESNFGARTGNFRIVEALATLAYDGRRAGYFRTELINALRILDAGDIAPAAMTGSWAGAMGQPQFMPSSYLRYAVDANGDGRRDIWRDTADIFGSVANYLGKSGWRAGEPWGQPIRLPENFDARLAGRDAPRTLAAWQALGVRRIDGSRFSRADVQGAIVIPDGPTGEAFMTYANFKAIRRYNPSDYYALAVGLLGSAVA